MTETRKVFHEELAELCSDVVRLSAMASEAIQAGSGALLEFDLTSAERVITDDAFMDALAYDMEERVYLLLARQQPMAVDLRTLVTIVRVVHELERIGDLMGNVAKAARRLYPRQLDPRLRGLIDRMREQATAQLQVATDAFAERDQVRARALADMDDVMDDLQKELFRTIFSFPARDEAAVQLAVQVALVGRYFERIADHAVNVAERVAYMVTGALSAHRTSARRRGRCRQAAGRLPPAFIRSFTWRPAGGQPPSVASVPTYDLEGGRPLMQRYKSGIVRMVALSVVLALGAAACGSDDKTDTGTGGTTDTTAAVQLTGTLKGSGATFPKAFYEVAIAGFKDGAAAASPSTTPAAARARAARTCRTAWSTSPAPTAWSRRRTSPSTRAEFLYFPTVAAPITVSYNLDGVDDLDLDADTIAKIFQRQITTWDDPAIKAVNPDANLPVDRHRGRPPLRRLGHHRELHQVPGGGRPRHLDAEVGLHRRVAGRHPGRQRQRRRGQHRQGHRRRHRLRRPVRRQGHRPAASPPSRTRPASPSSPRSTGPRPPSPAPRSTPT